MRSILSLSLTLWAASFASAQDVTSPGTGVLPESSPTIQPQPTMLLASVGTATTVFCNIPGLNTAQVPGLTGVEFAPSTTSSSIFDRPFGSPNGNWVITALTNLPTASDEVLILNGTTVVAHEGDPAPFDGVNLIGTLDTRVGVNDAGSVVFATNTSPSTVNDDFIVKVTAGTFVAVAQEGAPTATLPGVTYDDGLDGASIVANGDVGFEADGIDGTGITTANDDIIELGSALIAQEGVTIPGNQGGGTTDFWQTFDLEDTWFDATGANQLLRGDTNGATATDDIVVVNGNVVLQEGFIIPGSSFANPIDDLGIVYSNMDKGGNWYARGNNDITEDDWVVRNGVVIAAVGQPIVTGSGELFDDAAFADCFFAHTGNSNGDYVVAGVTDNPNLLTNGVIVLNGKTVVCRENDPVDLDNNGMFDDGAFFNTFGNDDMVLTNDCKLYFTATFRDAGGAQIGHGFFMIQLQCDCGTVTSYGSGCAGSGGFTPNLGVSGCLASGQTITVSVDSALGGTTGIFFVGASPQSLPVPNSPCSLLLNPILGVSIPLSGAGPGGGTISIPALLPPGLVSGASAYLQVFVVDPGVAHGFSTTNGVQLTFP